MRTVRIISVQNETARIRSFAFQDELSAKGKPGQFAMIWVPGVDEVPMSLSRLDPVKGSASVTVEKVGDATSALHRMKPGDVIGVRGPFGNGFTTSKMRDVVIVGGGSGLAVLAPLVERLGKKGARITLLLGAKTSADILFLERLESVVLQGNGRMIVATEDGSRGSRGLITEQAESLLSHGRRFDMIYTCGPEKMMYKVFLLAEQFNVSLEASLERFMRCAIGLCGTCVIGKYRVCQDGPVFTRQQLSSVKDEFGRSRKGLDGRKIPV